MQTQEFMVEKSETGQVFIEIPRHWMYSEDNNQQIKKICPDSNSNNNRMLITPARLTRGPEQY